jgi:phosphoadenosine phosphosulfate reductase
MSLNEIVITDAGYIGEHNKVRTAVDLLREFEPMALSFDPRGYCITTSGGKDSRTVETIAQMSGVKYFLLHNITGIDPPELVYFLRDLMKAWREAGIPYVDQMYDESMWQLLMKNLSPPLRTKRWCCRHLKERGGEGSLCCTGVRWQEGNNRAKNRNAIESLGGKKSENMLFNDNNEGRRLFENCNLKRKVIINPIISWTVGDIWDFSREYNVIQCLLYAEGFDRLGCIGCPQGQEYGRKRDFARWPGFQRTWIYWFGRVMEIRKEKGLKCTFKSAEDWFEWWLSDKAQEMPIARGSLKCSGMIRNVRGLSRLCAAAARLRQAHGGLHQGAGGCGV